MPGPSTLLAVDPLLLAVAGRPLEESAAALRDALPAVDAAWLAAAHALRAQHTGHALDACLPGLRRDVQTCIQQAAGFGQALAQAAGIYASAEASALPHGSGGAGVPALGQVGQVHHASAR